MNINGERVECLSSNIQILTGAFNGTELQPTHRHRTVRVGYLISDDATDRRLPSGV